MKLGTQGLTTLGRIVITLKEDDSVDLDVQAPGLTVVYGMIERARVLIQKQAEKPKVLTAEAVVPSAVGKVA